MALTTAQKSDCRRHLKYPVVGLIKTSTAGGSLASGAAGYRFFQAYGFLEYKLNNLNPDEEARLLGLAYAAIALLGPQPNPGDTVSVTLSGGPISSPQTLTATAGAPAPGADMRINLVNALAAACAANTVLQAAGILGVSPYGAGPYSQNAVAIPEISFNCPQAFSISASGVGLNVPQVTATGALLPPTTTAADGTTVLYGYIPILNSLEGDYYGTSQNLDTIKADVWTGRNNELGQRRALYENLVQLLSDFLGTPINRQAKQRPTRTGAVRFA
jgi:hypothetical protein